MKMEKYKILLVDDNRDVLNWGCRATSISLSQVLSEKYPIIDIINKQTVDGPQLISKIVPINEKYLIYFNYIDNVLHTKITSKVFFIKDFIEKNPEKSLRTFLKYKDNYKNLRIIYSKVKSADIIVINGEGSMIFTTPARRDLLFQLFIIELSVHLKKQVFYVNSIVSDCPLYGRNNETVHFARKTLSKCNYVTVRDPESYKILKEIHPELNFKYVPDALFKWVNYYNIELYKMLNYPDFIVSSPENNIGKLNFVEPYICIGGSSLAAWYENGAVPTYVNLVNKVKELGLKVYIIQTCNGDSFLHQVSEMTNIPLIPISTPILSGGAILANAELFISGRYHPSILASLGGTPCIFLSSNSHKTKSLQKVLEYKEIIEFPALPNEDDCDKIISVAKSILADSPNIRERIKKIVLQREKEVNDLITIIDNNLNQNLDVDTN